MPEDYLLESETTVEDRLASQTSKRRPRVTYADVDIESMATLMSTLPQELKDEVLEYISPITLGDKVYINRHYQPPCQLYLNHAMREETAQKFYSTAIFQFDDRTYLGEMDALGMNRSWLRSLPLSHRQMIRTVEYHRIARVHLTTGFFMFSKTWAMRIVEMVNKELRDEGVILDRNNLFINYFKFMDLALATRPHWQTVGNVMVRWGSDRALSCY